MKADLLYFSGTGNGLWLARTLGDSLVRAGWQVSIRSLADREFAASCQSEADAVGLVFPVYYLDIPPVVKAFVERLRVKAGAWTFVMSHCGATDWGVGQAARTCFRKAGIELDSVFRFLLPDNSVVFATPKDQHEAMFETAAIEVGQVATAIAERREVFMHTGHPLAGIAGKAVKAWCEGVYGFRDLGLRKDSCSQCGLCARLCPMGVISMEGGSPAWNGRDRCESCFACLHGCPQGVVGYRSLRDPSAVRYVNPRIKTAELLGAMGG